MLNKFAYGPVLADALRAIYLRNLHAFTTPEWEAIAKEVAAPKWINLRWYDERVTIKMLYVCFFFDVITPAPNRSLRAEFLFLN